MKAAPFATRHVGVTRSKRILGLTYAAERYGERSRPSPFLFVLAGHEARLLTWTGPKLSRSNTRGRRRRSPAAWRRRRRGTRSDD